jgi:glycosyltransferase involved in cell wall biosynthesis
MMHREKHTTPPLVSIGLPVYNGETYLRESLDAILAQTFTDLEVIICDNASTDGTAGICAEYVARDPRVRYVRNEINIGGGRNFNKAFQLASGTYFHWSTDDDRAAPEYIERCVAVLQKDPAVVLCMSHVVLIDGEGKAVGMEEPLDVSGDSPSARFRVLTAMRHQCEAVFGVMRASVLAQTGLLRSHTDADRTLLSELGLRGKFHQIPEKLFFRRSYAGNSIKAFPDWRARMEWFDPIYRAHLTAPHLSQCMAYLGMIMRSPIGFRERLRCYVRLVDWLIAERHGRYIAKDILLAALWLARLPFRGKRVRSASA